MGALEFVERTHQNGGPGLLMGCRLGVLLSEKQNETFSADGYEFYSGKTLLSLILFLPFFPPNWVPYQSVFAITAAGVHSRSLH